MSIEKLNTEIRQDQIAQAALSLIASHGLKGLNMAKLARRVGLVPSAIYRHFKNKEEVLDSVLNHIQKRLLDNVDMVLHETSEPIDRLRQLIMYHVKLIRENQGILRIIFSEDIYNGHPERKTRIYNIITTYLSRVGKIVSQGQREGKIRRDTDPTTISFMFLGMVQSAAILWHMSDDGFDVTKRVENAWKIFNEYIKVK